MEQLRITIKGGRVEVEVEGVRRFPLPAIDSSH